MTEAQNKFICLFERQKEKISTDSLLQCLQELGLGQAEIRAHVHLMWAAGTQVSAPAPAASHNLHHQGSRIQSGRQRGHPATALGSYWTEGSPQDFVLIHVLLSLSLFFFK